MSSPASTNARSPYLAISPRWLQLSVDECCNLVPIDIVLSSWSNSLQTELYSGNNNATVETFLRLFYTIFQTFSMARRRVRRNTNDRIPRRRPLDQLVDKTCGIRFRKVDTSDFVEATEHLRILMRWLRKSYWKLAQIKLSWWKP